MIKRAYLKWAAAFLFAVLAAASFFWASDKMSDPDTYGYTLSYLNEKKETVMHLVAVSTATSAAVSLLPGDTATPIAEKLADVSSYFLVVISAIYLEKYLLTTIGYIAFRFLIPAALVLFIVRLFWKKDEIVVPAKKLLALGLAMVVIIPSSVRVSRMIEETYSDSIESTIASAKRITDEVQEEDTSGKESGGWLSGLISSVKDTVSEETQKVESTLNGFIEALAVLIVTSCLIPVLTLLFFWWIIKILLGLDISFPRLSKDRHEPRNSPGLMR